MKLTKNYLKTLIKESLQEIEVTPAESENKPVIIKTGNLLSHNLKAISSGNYEDEDLETLVTLNAFDEFKCANLKKYDWPSPKELNINTINEEDYYKIGDIAAILGFM